jgi:hypothetical protein
MTTYNTRNPLGSSAAKDLYDNAQNLDHFVNDLDQVEWADRFGVLRKTWWGMEADFQNQMEDQEHRFVVQLDSQADRFNIFIQNSGYSVVGDYEDGPLTIDEYNQIIRYQGEFYKLTASTDIPWTTTGNDATSWVADSAHLVAIGDAALRQEITGNDGLKLIGQCADIGTLRSTEPEMDGQRIFVREYAIRTGKGGGTFVYWEDDTTSADDGGYIIVTKGGKRWRRDCTAEMLNVTHYGAVMDGVTDDMPAVKRMYNGMLAQSGNSIGVRTPAGDIALSSTFDLSGEAEQGLFRFRGPDVEYGTVPLTRIHFINKTSVTPVFQVNARRMEISGLHFIGEGTVTPFYKNVCTAGQYIRVKSIRCNGNGGLVFDVQDTIDTKFDQIYCSKLSGGFLQSLWSNTQKAGWNHSTAIEISNSNFSSNTTVDVLRLIRCGQSIMRNVWFSNNEYTYDISQGGWLLDTVIMENSTYPAKTKWAKTTEINCRFAQGATVDNTLSGYTPDMDNGGAIPDWVTNVMDQGRTSIGVTGTTMQSGFASAFKYTDTVLQNSNNAETWFYVGRITLPVLGHTAIVRFLGAAGWETTATPVTRPGSTNFGGGEARLYIEMKKPNEATTGTIEAHWHGEGGTPVKEIRLVHSWQTIHLYVRIAQYARATGVFIETNSRPRLNSGSPFYFMASNSQLSNIDEIVNNVVVPRRWAVNSGSYDGNGFGMDLDAGNLLLQSSNLKSVNATEWIPIFINGEPRYIQYQEFNDAIRFPRYTYAELPDPAKTTYGMCFCTDTTRTPKMQMLYASNDGLWYPVNNPADKWKPI